MTKVQGVVVMTELHPSIIGPSGTPLQWLTLNKKEQTILFSSASHPLSLLPQSPPSKPPPMPGLLISSSGTPPPYCLVPALWFYWFGFYHNYLHTFCLLALDRSSTRTGIQQFLPGPCLDHSAQNLCSLFLRQETNSRDLEYLLLAV